MLFKLSSRGRWARPIVRPHGAAWRYGVAFVAVGGAVGLRLLFRPVVDAYAPYVPFGVAVTVASLFGGRGPGLAAVGLSVLAVDWFFLEPYRFLSIGGPAATWAFGLFLASAVGLAFLIGSLRQFLVALARTEEALCRQAELIDLSTDAVITMDRGRRILSWNAGAEELYGWRERDMLGKGLHQQLQTSGSIPLEELEEILHRDRRWKGELRQVARDGRNLVVDSRQVLLKSEGELPECILTINRDITERKRSDEALRASEARLQFVLDAAHLGAVDLDLTSNAMWRSPQHDAIFGYPSLLPEWTYEMFLDHVLPEDREEIDRQVRHGLASGADIEHECRIHRADGEMRWIWYLGRTQTDREGHPWRLTGIVRDITTRKKIEEDLRQSEEQFRTLANTIPQLCGMANPDGRFFWSNQRWRDYTGLSREQSEGWGWLAAVDREASSDALEQWERSIAAGEPFESVLAVRGADGIVRPFLARAMPVRGRDGEVVRWFGTLTDISEQRRTEDALRKAHGEALARATELQAIMEAAPVALFISRDAECRYILGNHRAYELFREPGGTNLSRSAREGEKAATYRVMRDGAEVPPDELPLQKAASTGEVVSDEEMELAFPDGRRSYIIGNAVPLLDAEGRSRGAVGIFVDISERKKTEERLRQAQKLESVGLLAGGIAHDFNNLLTIIMGNADFARMECPSCDSVRQILASSEQAAHLTRQLLAYAGKGQFRSETFDLTEFVSRCKERLSASVPKRVQLRFTLAPGKLLIKADPGQIEQVLVNLVINAGEAIPPQAEGWVEIATGVCEITAEAAGAHAPLYEARQGQFICLEVSDSGSGMDEATLAEIFNPFFSTKFTGRGLGLAAVQGIVRSCKGFIDVQSSKGGGSKFRIFLPSASEKPVVAILAGPDSGVSRERNLGQKAVVLVVDDEDMVRELACAALRGSGYDVLEAGSGADALETLAHAVSPPSLVLLDAAMPGMALEELVPILNMKYPDLRILLTSGYPEGDVCRGLPPGAVADFLQKPYTVGTLTQKVAQILGRGDSGQNILAA